MRISTQNLSNGFISEILNLFGINSKNLNNQFVLVEDSFLYNLSYNRESKCIELTSFIKVKDIPENHQGNINFIMKNHDPRIDLKFDNCKDTDGYSDILISFKYLLSEDNFLDDLEILNLHNLFDSLLYKANYLFREINIRRRLRELNSIDF